MPRKLKIPLEDDTSTKIIFIDTAHIKSKIVLWIWLPWLVLAGEREDGEMLALVKRKTMQLFQSLPWTN
jgi:hypothetical protein